MKRQLLIILALSGAAVCSQAQDLDQTKEMLSRWVETRKLISEEKQKWTLEREMLSDRIDLIRTEKDSLTQKIHETQADITAADEKREDMVRENDSLKSASATLVNRISSLEQGVLELIPTLPAPIQERIRMLSQRLPKSDETELSLSERYQNIIGIVNELNKAAQEIIVVSEVRELGDGTKAEGQTLYIGFGCAYWCKNKGDMAQIGMPGPDGWIWTAHNEIASGVADAISIMKNEKVAEFISLPVSVRK
ncbi:MAG: DUF3450 family protein [Pontiellaceae bacterium]|nr:DUF3450 family protein [Pontiellaceae bacterium]MBN2784723.1 DUF3450 family protein [Pontiellaceae bacterium]